MRLYRYSGEVAWHFGNYFPFPVRTKTRLRQSWQVPQRYIPGVFGFPLQGVLFFLNKAIRWDNWMHRYELLRFFMFAEPDDLGGNC